MNIKRFAVSLCFIAFVFPIAIGAAPAAAQTQQALDKSLFAAIEQNDVKRAKSLLQRGASANARDEYGKTALVRVSFIGGSEDETTNVDSTDLLKLFLKYNADVNRTDAESNGPLMEAASSSLEATRLLLGKGARVNAQNNAGATALMRAVAGRCEALCSSPQCVEILLARGAKTNIADEAGETALTLTAQLSLYDPASALRNAKMLLARGADVSARTRNGNTTLKWAKVGGNPTFIRLIQNALDKNKQTKTPATFRCGRFCFI